jgi:hypothetical protein
MKGKLLSVVLKTTQKHNIKFETQNPWIMVFKSQIKEK